MKFLIVKIIRDTNPNRPTMRYPAIYNAQELEGSKVGPIVYDGSLGRGEDTEECLICVKDALATSYLVDPDIREVTRAEVDIWLQANKKVQELPDEVVTDPNRMLAILAKKAAGIAVSREDLDALDPDKTVRGVNRVPKTVASLFPTVK